MGLLTARRSGAAVAALFGLALVVPSGVAGQLISPGKLSSPHAQLEGIRNCTQCHQLGKPGSSPDLCLGCHQPLARRIREGSGYHATLTGKRCAECHTEHFGTDFALVELDTLTFDHTQTGYALEGAHAAGTCRQCHTANAITDPVVRSAKQEHGALDRTFLGLPTECASCHDADSPHQTQFAGRACTECHDLQRWEGAVVFDHDRTRYRLTGSHRTVACEGCHAETPRGGGEPPFVRYVGVKADGCNDCHDDVHHGAMAGTCNGCHNTSGWLAVDRTRVESTFDHSTTGFALVGSHARTACESCHDVGTADALEGIALRFVAGSEGEPFPAPEAGRCLSCHTEQHDSVFAARDDQGDCASCHGQDTWSPADYDAARHNREAGFELEGAHVAVACDDCHVPTADPPTFRLSASTCTDCHADTQPHADQFEGRACDECHGSNTFAIPDFDHDRTRYPLDGAHVGAPCAACHRAESAPGGSALVRYRPLGIECADCHGGGS